MLVDEAHRLPLPCGPLGHPRLRPATREQRRSADPDYGTARRHLGFRQRRHRGDVPTRQLGDEFSTTALGRLDVFAELGDIEFHPALLQEVQDGLRAWTRLDHFVFLLGEHAVARELALHFILVVVILLRSARQRGVADRREPVRGRQLALELVRILGEPV